MFVYCNIIICYFSVLSVRARSIACFAQFTSSNNPVIQKAVMELFFPSQQSGTPSSLLTMVSFKVYIFAHVCRHYLVLKV